MIVGPQPNLQLTCQEGVPALMGSATGTSQIKLDVAMEGRNKRYGVQDAEEAMARAELEAPWIHGSKHLCSSG